MKFIHISDLHYHRCQDDNVDANALLEKIKARYPDHALIITGDITDDGHPRQYENALKALLPFKGQVFIVPGNHDFGAAGLFYDKDRAERFDAMLGRPLKQLGAFAGDNSPVVTLVDNVMLIALDSNLETLTPFDFACGEIGYKQLSELYHIVNAENLQKILFFHHHPFMLNDPFMKLKDAKELAKIIYGQVDVVLFGHRHKMGIWEGRWDIPYIAASDNSPGKDRVGEISIEDGVVGFDYLEI